MVMSALREGAKGGISKFILFGFMVLATGGLVMMDVGGFFRGGVASGDVAKVGEQTIPLQSFDQNVRRTITQLGMSPQEAYRLGYINQILSGEIRASLLRQASSQEGIHVPDSMVAQRIQLILAPYTAQGQDPQSVLNQILLSQGMSERMFVNSIARDMGNEILTGALEGGVADISDEVAQDIYKFQKEKRSIEYIALMNKDLKDIPAPNEEQLQTLYQSIRENYATEETRRFKLISIDTTALKKTLEIPEDELRQTYEDNIDLYTQKEQRTLEQALIQDEGAAKATAEAAKAGKSLEQAVKDSVGNASGYLGERVFTNDNLIEDVKEAVLASEKSGDVIGPISSPLGYYVVVVKKHSPEKVKSFESVKAEIKDELMDNAVIDEQYAMANTVDDMLASGMSIEEVTEEVDVDVQTLPEVNAYGLNKNGKSALEKQGDNASNILQSGFELLEGETSPMYETPDGKLMGVYVESVTPKSYKTFEEVRSELEKRWMDDQRRVGTRILASQFLTQMQAEQKSISDVAKAHGKQVFKKTGLERNKDPDGKLNVRSVANIFEAPLDTPILVDIDDGIAIARVTDFEWPKDLKAGNEEFAALKQSLAEGTANEGMYLYVQEKQNDLGAKVNQALLERAYGPESQSY